MCDSVPYFRDAAIEIPRDRLVDEASPETVLLFETLLPEQLDVIVVGLEKLIESGGSRVSILIGGRR